MTSAVAHQPRLAHPYSEGGLILLYHRVAELEQDPLLLGVSPRNFAEQIEALRSEAEIVSLQEIVRAAKQGRAAGKVAITFDDGYADNLEFARPVLARLGVPATVFVVTGYVGGVREFWWDELERHLLLPGEVPTLLQASFQGEPWSFDLGESARFTQTEFATCRHWSVLDSKHPTKRHQAYLELFERLRPMKHQARQDALAELFGDSSSAPRRSHRALCPDELVKLADGGLVEIGGHTLTHPLLASLDPAAQVEEISGCREQIETWLGQPVCSFSYPFGTRRDYTPETVCLVREAGFDLACSNFTGAVQASSDRLQLPRVLVRDWDGEELQRRLRGSIRA